MNYNARNNRKFMFCEQYKQRSALIEDSELL